MTFSKLAGKVVAVTFTYLRCPNPAYCFRLASNFGQLQKRFADRLGKDLVLLTIVIDPEHDEKGALAEYARIWTTESATGIFSRDRWTRPSRSRGTSAWSSGRTKGC